MTIKKMRKKRNVVKRRTTKKRTVKSSKLKTKKPFGGYAISFKNRKETLEQVFGKADIPPSQMTKKLWEFVKAKGLGHK
tara:strand:- start:240 stop:476 length:237 start_codon:yes stop_codon:yes gene_type:complete